MQKYPYSIYRKLEVVSEGHSPRLAKAVKNLSTPQPYTQKTTEKLVCPPWFSESFSEMSQQFSEVAYHKSVEHQTSDVPYSTEQFAHRFAEPFKIQLLEVSPNKKVPCVFACDSDG